MNETPKYPPAIPLEITDDLVTCRALVEAMVKALNTGPRSRPRSIAVTKLEEASMWLNEALRLE